MLSPFYNFKRNAYTPGDGRVIVSPGNILPEAERLNRLSICTVCEFNLGGLCSKCRHCGGRKISLKVQAMFEFCPLTPPKWGPWKELPP